MLSSVVTERFEYDLFNIFIFNAHEESCQTRFDRGNDMIFENLD